jgi:hypothetical protein
MPPARARALCLRDGHRYVTAGVKGLFEFEVCERCGALPYSRGEGR